MKLSEPFCLACGDELAEPLRRTASLRCHDCREGGEPISFELALRARSAMQAQSAEILRREPPAGRTAA
jgi:hypothetical protein